TIAYMSPEQVRGEDLDSRTDLFSFGAVLYEMATGQHAFSGRTSGMIFDAILNREPASARRLNLSLPVELEQIFAKALEKERDVRYQHAADIRADLKRLKRDSESGRVATLTGSSKSQVRRWSPRRFGAWLVLVVGLVLLTVLFALRWFSKGPELPHAELKQRRLTANPGDNPADYPVISPDGRYLAYCDNSGIHVKLIATGETQTIAAPRRLTEGRDSWT